MDINKYIGEKIRSYRQSKNITQEELAEFLGVSTQSISRYELGDRKTDNDILFRIADYFNISINDLFPPINGFTEDIIADYMGGNSINTTQLAILCKLSPKEINKIISGEEKLPKPSSLIKIANALKGDPFDFLIAAGYVEDPEDVENEIYNTGIRYLLSDDERKNLCLFLKNYWNSNSDNHEYTYEEIYENLFVDEKDNFSSEEVRNIIVHNNSIQNIDSSIVNNNDDNNESINEMDKYRVLFDKDNRLTPEQKEFFIDMIETQHRKFDEAQENGNVN